MKPHVICHMMMSLDGRIVSSRWQLSPAGRSEYEATAADFRADAWMCGRITMAAFAQDRGMPSGASKPSDISKVDYIAPHNQNSYAVGLDPRGKIYWGRNDITGDHVVTVLTEAASSEYLAYLRSCGVSYLFGGRDSIDLPKTLGKLVAAFGIKTLLLEGGGKINGSMLRNELIDGLSVLVAPVVDGLSGMPALFDTSETAPPPIASPRWRLKSVDRRADDILWLRYERSTS
jgi:2,5-diamino-6-(ribosylamino)-4(3H)-pyrimidinone 5'-phosphate reductase